MATDSIIQRQIRRLRTLTVLCEGAVNRCFRETMGSVLDFALFNH